MGRIAGAKPTLFQRKDSPNYWARFSLLEQGQIRIALGTADPIEAERLAQKEFGRAQVRAEWGLLTFKSCFENVAREYIEELKAAVPNGAKKSNVLRDYPQSSNAAVKVPLVKSARLQASPRPSYISMRSRSCWR